MFCTSFYINPLKFLLSISTSLLLCSKQVQRNCLHFFNKIIKKIVHALRVNETKVTSRKTFSEKRDQKMTKELSLESPFGSLICVKSQALNAMYMWSSRLFQFQPLFQQFLQLLQLKTNFIKFCVNFYIKQVKFFAVQIYQFAVAQKTSTAKLQPFFQKFLKTVRTLRFKETKITSKKPLTVNVFPFQSKKKSKGKK